VFKSFLQKPLWVHFLVALGIVTFLFVGFFSSLGWLTKHDANERVPLVLGKKVDDATAILEAKGFDVEIQDSIYVDTAAPLAVMKQSPEADLLVKRNRTVYLTINRAVAPLIEMPDLKGFSFRSAEVYLQSMGLKLGDTTYKPDIARNSVLEQLFNGKPIAPGTKVSMGSSISFVLGSGIGNTTSGVPDLVGLTLAEARELLSSMNIGISAIIPEGEITDQEKAYIIKQSPEAYTVLPDGSKQYNSIRPGQLIDLWIGLNPPAPPVSVDSTQQ
jgi:beta-lactam-binding protein with PASTA domain